MKNNYSIAYIITYLFIFIKQKQIAALTKFECLMMSTFELQISSKAKQRIPVWCAQRVISYSTTNTIINFPETYIFCPFLTTNLVTVYMSVCRIFGLNSSVLCEGKRSPPSSSINFIVFVSHLK